MAATSSQPQPQLGLKDGRLVEMEGIMEVRFSSDDFDFKYEPEDLMDFQARVREIPDDFCHKNKKTTLQAFFYCLVNIFRIIKITLYCSNRI